MSNSQADTLAEQILVNIGFIDADLMCAMRPDIRALAALAKQQASPEAQAAVLFVSPEQFEQHDPQATGKSNYLPCVRRAEGKFTMPLYITPPSAPRCEQAAGADAVIDANKLRSTLKLCLEALEEYQHERHPCGTEGAQRAATAMSFARFDLAQGTTPAAVGGIVHGGSPFPIEPNGGTRLDGKPAAGVGEQATGGATAAAGPADQRRHEFLNWVADRLVHKYGENPNVDFVLALRRYAGEPDVDDGMCPAIGFGECSIKPVGPNGAPQCEWCGEPPALADKINEIARSVYGTAATPQEMAFARAILAEAGIKEKP